MFTLILRFSRFSAFLVNNYFSFRFLNIFCVNFALLIWREIFHQTSSRHGHIFSETIVNLPEDTRKKYYGENIKTKKNMKTQKLFNFKNNHGLKTLTLLLV